MLRSCRAPIRPIDELAEQLREHAYLADRGLATVLHLSLALEKPLLLEGEAGVGKTELAKVLAEVTGGRLIRLQCYEGIDVAHALYDWSYTRQLLYIRTLEAAQAASGKERCTSCSAASSWSGGRCWTRSRTTTPSRRCC